MRKFFQDYGKGYLCELIRTLDFGDEVLFCGGNQKLKFPISDSVTLATESIHNPQRTLKKVEVVQNPES